MAAVALHIPRTSSPIPDSQRASAVSASGSSFQTAQSAPLSPSDIHSFRPDSLSSSNHTISQVPPAPDFVNPLHSLAKQSQEVHVLKVTDDTVELETGHAPESLLHKVGRSLANVPTVPVGRRAASDSAKGADMYIPQIIGDTEEQVHTAGPPPPSPPASEEHLIHDESPSKSSRRSNVVSFDSPVRERRPSATSSLSFDHSTRQPRAGPSSQPLHRSSTDTKRSGTSAIHPRNAHSEGNNELSPPKTVRSMTTNVSSDAYLQPPTLSMTRPKRRNTIGTPASPISPLIDDIGDGELATEIYQQQEQIMRERNSKRAKAQQAEAALTRSKSRAETERPLVGSWVKEGHANYVLMYNMLTGIRIAVSRCQAKLNKEIGPGDYKAAHKYSFDIFGNELTPSVKYDFKFKDYAPWVFRELREEFFHLDPADYLLSLTEKYILSELGSPGKSGSFFYFSRDYRFIIKTIHHNEHKFIRSILKDYHVHVKNNPHTLLSRFYGLHRVKLPRGRKIHFVIMNNLFPPHKDIHETYDLKGSTVGRIYPEDEAARKQYKCTLKDLNWINRGNQLELGPEKRALLTEQIRRDAELLKKVYVMDYSLLVGVHNMKRGNKDNVRRNTLKVFSVPEPGLTRRKTQAGTSSPEAIAMRKAMRASDAKHLEADPVDRLSEAEAADERQHFIFYQDEGGLQATDEANEAMDTIYYLGIIDICTPYTTFKRVEHIWKGMQADRHKISPVEPGEYGDRFFNFLTAIMRGGEGGARFKAE